MAYTASCGALAALEYLGHAGTLPVDLMVLSIEIPDTLQIEKVNAIPGDPAAFKQIGDEWLKSNSTGGP